MTTKTAPAAPAIGSYWASNFILHLGRVVRVNAVDGNVATCEIVRSEDDTPTRVMCNAGMSTDKVGKIVPVKIDKFRQFDNPIHRGYLPANGPDDFRTSILTHEDVHPIKHRGLQPGPLLRLKYEHGWIVRAETGEVVDYDPRRKGDARPWRTPSGERFRAGQCTAEFPEGVRAWWGTTTETDATTFPTDRWFTVAHLMVGETAGNATCGTSVWRLVHPEDALGLRDDLSVRAAMCEKCEADQPDVVMKYRMMTRLGEWTDEPTGLPTGTFDLSELGDL